MRTKILRLALCCVVALVAALLAAGCVASSRTPGQGSPVAPGAPGPGAAGPGTPGPDAPQKQAPDAHPNSALIVASGKTLQERFLTPGGFERVGVDPGSFAHLLRTLPLKAHGAEVKHFDGSVKANRGVYEAVVDIDVGTRDLQQCADAIMRLMAEYLFGRGRYDEIHFNFANGFRADYSKWAEGYRVVVAGNVARWVKSAQPSRSYSDFRKYLDIVFSYANTVSLAAEMQSVSVVGMAIGDVFVDKGHALIVVDMAQSTIGSKKLFMIAQSYMPAQDIQVLCNPGRPDLGPWYELDFGDVLRTPEWTFTAGDLRRFR
ncbi:MAG: DUF4846 domain-containing protein [Bacillota bacterium]|nr:DUF4846 domain-containing protein [Bacillota bacterium]